MMKKIGKLLKDKRWSWTAGGVMCLMVAAMIFALSADFGSEAVWLNGIEMNLTGANDVYEIDDYTALIALGDASADETKGKTFQLVKDITINSLTAPATGTFAGTFDGNGHVITIENVEIVEEDTMNATDPQMSGLLFGKVTGTVKNVIIDIEDNDASYVRKTKTEYESYTQEAEYEEEKNPLIAVGEVVSGLDKDPTKAEEVHYALTVSEDGTISGPVDGIFTQTLQEKGSQTTTYAPKTGKTNYFGVICGENTGTIQQVLVTGNDVSVAKIDETETLDYSQIVQPGYREEIYQYKQETVSDSGEEETQALSVDGTAYLSRKDYSVNFTDNELQLTVSTPKKVAIGSKITYEVTVKNNSSDAYANVSLSASSVGVWIIDNDQIETTANRTIDIGTIAPNGNKTIQFVFDTVGLTENVSMNFTLSGSNGATATEETKIATATLNGVTTILVDTTETTLEEKNHSIAGLRIDVSAPIAVEKEDEEKFLVYNIKITNTSARNYSNVKIQTSEEGKWTSWSSSDKPTEKNLGLIKANSSSEISFTVKADDDIEMNFSVTGECNGESTTESNVTASILGISTDFYDAEEKTVSKEFKNGLKAYLTLLKKGISSEESWSYKLVLENTNEQPSGSVISQDIQITGGLELWEVSNNNETTATAFSNNNPVIPAGKKVVLIKTTKPSITGDALTTTYTEKVEIKAVLTTSAYKYTNVTAADMESKPFVPVGPGEKSGKMILPENPFYAGGIAGKSTGVVGEIKQEIALSGSTSPGEFKLGGIAGEAEAVSERWEDIYMTGTSDYYGNGSGQPASSTTSEPTSALNDNWASISKYEKISEDEVNISEQADLKWLVKDAEFSYSEPSEKLIEATLKTARPTNRGTLTYTIGYNARRSLDETSEDIIYVSEQNSLDIGDSGYYRLLNVYATDGYYHYKTPLIELSKAEYVYPYDSDAPYTFEDNVTRTLNPLEDNVVISFIKDDEVARSLEGNLYYEINNSTILPTAESDWVELKDGVASIPYEITPSTYRFTPVIEGHIYLTQTTEEFKNVEPLPAPKITCFAYYDAKGDKNTYTEFVSNGSYEAGTDMIISPDDEFVNDYTFRYKFAEGLLDSDASDWKGNIYIGNDKIMIDASDYSGAAVIPDSDSNNQSYIGKEDIYLYVEVTKKSFSTVYKYGPFKVINGIQMFEYLNGKSVGEQDADHRVLDGDIVTLTINPTDVEYNGIQYIVSSEPTASFNNWSSYDGNTGIKLSENTGGYIYARIKYDEQGERFGAPQLFDFTFGSACASPIITPNTGLSTSGEGSAAIIDSTTLIGLSSRTEGAEVFYVASNADNTDKSMSIEMERALREPNDKQDGIIEDDYKYFMVGERWYRTRNTNVQKYTSGLGLSHSEEEAKYMYITAVAVADDYKISDELTFIYKVKPPQQVKAPEATFETRFTPGGENVETATVSKDGKLSFYSITPGAVLYYALGTTGDNWIEIPEDGVPVDGDFGGNFVVRVQAKKFAENSEEEIMLPSEVITFVYRIAEQEQANAPTATPATSADVPTTVIPGNKILLSTTTKGADIFYTTDGTTPQVELTEVENEDGTKTNKYQKKEGSTTEEYNSEKGIEMPLDGKDYFTITAIAVKDGLGTSPEARFTYVYPDTVLAPYANIDSGKVELNTKVLLKNLTEGAVIYYNAAYGADIKEEKVEEPTLSSTVFNEQYPFTITQKTIVKAMAAKDGVKSSVVTFIFDPMAQLAVPTASIETGSVVSNGTVLQLSAAKGATIYYTIDGSDPADSANPAVMSGNNVTLNGEPGGQITIKAIAKAVDNSQSEIVTFTYQFSQNAMGGVTANIATGSTVSNGTKVILMSDVSEAEIYYTTDGESPVEHGKKGTTVEINGTPGTLFTIKAVAKVNGDAGIVSTFIYKIKEKPEEPTASPAGGTLTAAVRVSLDSGAEKIYYTTDGTEPTKSSDLYNEPIPINRTTTLKAIAVSEDGEVSDVATFQYTAAPKAAMPKSDWETGQVVEPGIKVKLWSDTPNTTIYYSTDGTDPTVNNLESLLIYDSEGIEINRSVTIKAVAQIEGMRLSNVSTWDYIVDVIPAVEMKKEEAAKLAEEGLKDTDASELNRKNDKDASDEQKRVLKEKKHNTMLISAKENIADNAVLYAEEKEINRMAVRNAQTLFGDDYTILSEYEIRLKSGKSYVQPNGEVEVVIPIPKGYENATLTVVTVDSKDKLTTLETRRENGMLYASTSSLREFAVVGLKSPEEFSRTFPYLLLLEITAGAVLVFGVVYYGMEKYKKYKKRK